MTKATTTQDLLETIRRHETAGAGLETATTRAPVVIATTEDIRAGSVWIKSDARLPESARFESKQYGHWKLLTRMDGFAVERSLSEAGWHFLFMVPGITIGALSSSRNGAIRRALKRILAAVEEQDFNGLEIVEITTRSFLGLHYARVVAHPRQVQNSPFVRDLDPYRVTRTVWDSERILRNRIKRDLRRIEAERGKKRVKK
jgi:hypothetical protein